MGGTGKSTRTRKLPFSDLSCSFSPKKKKKTGQVTELRVPRVWPDTRQIRRFRRSEAETLQKMRRDPSPRESLGQFLPYGLS